MRKEFISYDDFVVCRSPDGWSLHAPGSTDAAIASGAAPYLMTGPNDISPLDYLRAVEHYAPWAAEVIPADGGAWAFESVADAAAWRRQS
jgi:hypothetical protein